jgi:putative N6-adenine-specific DNA methylase
LTWFACKQDGHPADALQNFDLKKPDRLPYSADIDGIKIKEPRDRMYIYQKTGRYFAQVANDIKALATEELGTLGASQVSGAYRGLHFTAAPDGLYRINHQSRLISRVLAPLVAFPCPSDDALYRKAASVRWEDFLDPGRTFAVFASVSNSAITHSQFAGLRLKDAVVDYFRERTGRRPSIDTRRPDLWLNLHIDKNQAIISLDTSGGSLHRRGYRKQTVAAPMVETLAAAIIRMTEWDGRRPLADPFCGSGTLLCEAYLAASGTPAGILRKHFGFQHLPDYNDTLWQQVRRAGLNQRILTPPGLISGSDVDAAAVRAARANADAITANHHIAIDRRDAFDIPTLADRLIVCNPPYGIRIGRDADLSIFYRKLGDFLKQRCRTSTAFIYFGERAYIKNLGLKPSWKKPLAAGGLDGRLVKYELF